MMVWVWFTSERAERRDVRSVERRLSVSLSDNSNSVCVSVCV